MKHLIIDTNTLIHYKFFTEIPWQEIFEDTVKIIIPHKVVDELDKKKMSRKDGIQNRSRQILSNIDKIKQGKINLPTWMSFELFLESPYDKHISKYNLNTSIDDDLIIAACKLYEQKNPDADLLLITADNSLRWKAESKNIDAFGIDDDYKISLSKSDKDERIEELEHEVNQLKDTIPELDVVFSNDEKHLDFEMKSISINREQQVKEELEKIKKKYPKLNENLPKSDSMNPKDLSKLQQVIQINPFGPKKKPAKQYNKELVEFYDEYEEYLHRYYDYISLKNKSVNFKFIVENNGTAPAEDIDVIFHFPDGFHLFEEHNSPIKAPNNKPKPPSKKYKSIADIEKVLQPNLGFSSHIPSNIPSNTSTNIKKTNSYKYEFHIKKLKHNQHETTPELTVLFDSYDDVTGFSVNYKIQAADIPREITGELNFNVQLIE